MNIPYGGKLWQWENLANSLQNTFGKRLFGEFPILQSSSKKYFINRCLRYKMCKDSEDGDIHIFI